MAHILGGIGRTVVFGVCFILTLELATRFDQKITYGAPFWGKYTSDSALFTEDEYGIRGKPNAIYEKWQLNSLGFRGPEVAPRKAPGSLRIACFGASETFGLYETPGNDWPRQLERALGGEDAKVEVMNVAVAGMSLYQRLKHFEHRILSFQPDLVILMLEFPSYAGITPEKIAMRNAVQHRIQGDSGNDFIHAAKSIRSLTKLKYSILPKLPPLVQDLYRTAELRLKLINIKWTLGENFRMSREVNQFEIDTFAADVRRFYDIAQQHGVALIVASPAIWISEENILLFYASWPYIDESWIRAARQRFPEVAQRFAKENAIPFIDLSTVVSGRESDLMKDEVHYSDNGARVVAHVFANEVRGIMHGRYATVPINTRSSDS